MKFLVDTSKIQTLDQDAIVVCIGPQEGISGKTISELDHASSGFFTELEKHGDFPEIGQLAVFTRIDGIKARHVVICRADASRNALKKMAFKLWTLVSEKGWMKVALDFSAVKLTEDATSRVLLTALGDAAYRFDQFKSLDDAQKKVGKQIKKLHWTWLADEKQKKEIQASILDIQASLAGTYLARDLGNMPANVCTPSYLGVQAEKLAKMHESLTVHVLKKKEMQDLKMGALLGVAQGSTQSPRFIILEYSPKKARNKDPIILVGKGVTFDAGGISLKPSSEMDLMKYDMGGAAAVLGSIHAVATAALDVHVIGLIPAVENLPDGKALKPGDILTSMSGKTIEVLNTDAEGRLILCDALTYAERYKPQAVIDIATLTGACVIALGSPRAGLLGNEEALKTALFTAGEAVDDRVWKLPLDEEYSEMIKSTFADIANISNVREAGTITAAAFLAHFTKNYPWAHLDIAGVAWRSGGERKGGTGRPVGLLFEYLRRLAGV